MVVSEQDEEGSDNKSNNKSGTAKDKDSYIKSWSDQKVEDVYEGYKVGDYDLEGSDLKILYSELERRKIGPFRGDKNKVRVEPTEEPEEDEQVPIGYIKLYPDTPVRNDFYRRRYENARKAWGETRIDSKSETWFIVAKKNEEFGYDVHLYFTSDGTAHGNCTCADFIQRGVRRNFPCKHIFMVLVYEELTPKWEDSD